MFSLEDSRPTFNGERERERMQQAEEMENVAQRREGKGEVEKQAGCTWEVRLGGENQAREPEGAAGARAAPYEAWTKGWAIQMKTKIKAKAT